MTQKTRRKRSTTSRPKRTPAQQQYPGWLWMLFGLGIGLSVALAIYVKNQEPDPKVAAVAAAPASLPSALDNNDEVAAVADPEEAPAQRFDFYKMLPNFEVVIPEQETDVSRDSAKRVVEQPGNYVLQAGSFANYADADRRRAELAFQGIESRIQRVTIDDKTYHRVRIGPTRDLDELNLLRSRLHEAKIDALRIRLGD